MMVHAVTEGAGYDEKKNIHPRFISFVRPGIRPPPARVAFRIIRNSSGVNGL